MSAIVSRIDAAKVRNVFATHLPLYRRKEPKYQVLMLDSLLAVWAGHHQRLIDIGGGTGVMAEAMARLMPVDAVETVDLVDRFCAGLSVPARTYDGKHLPYSDCEFDAATLNNVLHHVPKSARIPMLREIRRVVKGPLYIKDHVASSRLDHVRLTLLDAIGNLPFAGMISTEYLSLGEWDHVAKEAGWRITAEAPVQSYRAPIAAAIFPNTLEITVRLEPA